MRYSLVIFSLLIGTGAFSQINRQFEVKTFTNLTDTNSNGIVDDGDVVNFTVRVENIYAAIEENQLFNDYSSVIFDQAILAEGGQLDDPIGYVNKVNKFLI